MSTAFAIGAVSAVLKNLLDNAVVNEPLASSVNTVKVSVLAPDLVAKEATDKTRLNLFLYHVEPNAAFRNNALPSRDGNGNRLTNAPLALDLYYLLTAYGQADFEAEILLGYAAQLLHEVPVLSRDNIRQTFATAATSPLKELAASELADQIEQIKITPHAMNNEETSKLWAALMTNYRPSIAYCISVVLIEAARPARTPLPVLRRNLNAFPSLVPPFPTLTAAVPPNKQPAARLGETITLQGHDLAGATVVARFEHARLATPLTQNAATIGAEEVKVALPNLPAVWPAGTYAVSLEVTRTGQPARTSNAVPLMVAPVMPVVAGEVDGTATRDGGTGKVTVVLNNVSPDVLPLQKAAIIVGDAEAQAKAHPAKTTTLTFEYEKAVAPPGGVWPVRLRIDGVESLLIRRDVVPPAFDANQKKTIP